MTDTNCRYLLPSAEIVCEEFDGEMVVLNLMSGEYFALNRSATFLMTGLLQGHAASDLSSVNPQTFSAEECLQFVETLVARGLLAIDAAGKTLPIAADTLERAQSLTEKPILEVHSDLADLIISDPIHDADEAMGWPVNKVA
jgi:hypothetical protein